MAAPNMAAITASLERSFQNFSLIPRPSSSSTSDPALHRSPSTDNVLRGNNDDDDDGSQLLLPNPDETALDLNSHVSLPYHWEQCLDLETGEIYYINWRNGMRSTEDPRQMTTRYDDGCFHSSDESCYDSEESSSETSLSSSRQGWSTARAEKDHVLVVAGCKSCLMYFMVPKRVEDCPKCSGQLIHFHRSENGGGSSL